MKSRFVSTGSMAVLVIVLALTLGGVPAAAPGPSASYDYLIGTGFICGFDPSACPVISSAPNGDTLTVAGSGTLSIHQKSVTGGGTFTHNFAAGGSIGGTWVATQLISFHSYGTSPGLPSTFEGGLALIRVNILVGGTVVAKGVMQVDCLIGNFPAGGAEGIRLAVAGAVNFNHEVSGFTLFVRTA